MTIKTSSNKFFLISFLWSCLLVSCASTPTSAPTEPPFPEPCIPLPDTGLPVGSSTRDSHILYQVLRPGGSEYELVYFTVTDGSRHFLANVKGSSMGFAFLKDRDRFVIPYTGATARVGSLEDTPPIVVPVDDELLSNFQPYSVFWSVLQEGSTSNFPDVSGYLSHRFPSPDGKKVATWNSGDAALSMTDTESGNTIQVIETQISISDGISSGTVTAGSWLPDGRRYIFAYSSEDEGKAIGQLYVVNSDGSELRPLLTPTEELLVTGIYISPDGKKALLIFSGPGLTMSFSDNDPLGVLTLSTNELKMFYIGIPLSNGILPFHSIVWSPDSEWIAFFAHSEQIDIRALNIVNGETYCITNDDLIEKMMDWR